MSILQDVNWHEVKYRYTQRKMTHEMLGELYRAKAVRQFSELLLGISEATGNYSARERRLGPRILSSNTRGHERFFELATDFYSLTDARSVPSLIRAAQLTYLSIGVGSEASCMLNPEVCWVANTRTIFSHFVMKHNGGFDVAKEEVRAYRNTDDESESAYRKWEAMHHTLFESMTAIASDGARYAQKVFVKPGNLKFLWADAISNWLYDNYY